MKKLHKKIIAGAMGGALLLGGVISNMGMVYAEICELRPSGICLPIRKAIGNQEKFEKEKLEKEKALAEIPRVKIIKDGGKRKELLARIDKEKKQCDKKYKDIKDFKEKLSEIVADGDYVIEIGNHLFFLHIDK